MVEGRPIRCPYCRKQIRWESSPERPFCSERCRQADLGNWAMERYRIAGEPVAEADLDTEDGVCATETQSRKT